MKWLLTKIGLLCARLISLLPMNILFGLADFLYFLLSRVYAYRKQIIDINLMHAFMHKRSEELWYIRENYYRQLADFFVEVIKSITISKKELQKRMQLHHNSYQLLREYEKLNQPIFVVLGHYNNWEWASLLAGTESQLPAIAVYQKPSNAAFDSFIKRNRSRFGCSLIATHQLKTLYAALLKQASLVAFVADQTPVDTESAYWTTFLGMETPFYNGFDKLAIRTNAIVLYTSIRKINRGYYEIAFETITTAAKDEQENQITEKFVRLLEKDIENRPEYWLWSHRRWKRAGIKY